MALTGGKKGNYKDYMNSIKILLKTNSESLILPDQNWTTVIKSLPVNGYEKDGNRTLHPNPENEERSCGTQSHCHTVQLKKVLVQCQ